MSLQWWWNQFWTVKAHRYHLQPLYIEKAYKAQVGLAWLVEGWTPGDKVRIEGRHSLRKLSLSMKRVRKKSRSSLILCSEQSTSQFARYLSSKELNIKHHRWKSCLSLSLKTKITSRQPQLRQEKNQRSKFLIPLQRRPNRPAASINQLISRGRPWTDPHWPTLSQRRKKLRLLRLNN